MNENFSAYLYMLNDYYNIDVTKLYRVKEDKQIKYLLYDSININFNKRQNYFMGQEIGRVSTIRKYWYFLILGNKKEYKRNFPVFWQSLFIDLSYNYKSV